VTAAAFVLAQLALLAVVVSTAGIAGAACLRLLPELGRGCRRAVAPALGLALLGHLFGGLALLGQLRRPAIVAVVVAIHLAALVRRQELFAALRPRAGSQAIRSVAGAALLGLPLFALALYPPSAFDETLYHLPFARAFATSGALPFLPELRFPVFPQLAETLSSVLLLAGGDTATHLLALAAVLLTAGLVAAWSSSANAPASATLWTGRWAAALWLGHPIVAYLAGTGYVEPLLALFVAGAFWAFARWQATGERAALVIAALFAASAADVKYLGLFFLAALGAAVLLEPGRRDGGRWQRAANIGVIAAVSVLALLPWYGRIFAFTGNPLFPFLPQLFGGSAWEVRLDAAPGSYLARLATLGWDVVFRRERVGQLPPFSPVVLLAIPAFAWLALRDRRARAPLALVAAWCLLFPLLPADARYLVPIVPLAAVALAVGFAGRLPKRLRTGAPAALLALALVAPGWLYAGYRLQRLGPLPVTAQERAAHLARVLPVYPAVEQLNREVRPGERTYLLFAEEMRYHLQGEVVGDWFGPHNYREIAPLLGDPPALAGRLRAIGVDYLLIGKTRGPLPSGVDAFWARDFVRIHDDAAAVLYRLD
jgi:hypothetical protein